MKNQELVVKNPAIFLKSLQEEGENSFKIIKNLFFQIETVSKTFKDFGETILFLNESLELSVCYQNNDVPHLIKGIKIMAITWDNACLNNSYQCGVGVIIKFIFAENSVKLNQNRNWECAYSSLRLTEKYEHNEKVGFVINSENDDKKLIIKDYSKFIELSNLIKDAAKNISLAYNE